jgi:putrescine transport system substrate-binding protein
MMAVAAEEEKILNVYNWSDYIAEDTVANFEKETGIKVRYDLFDSNSVLESKLLAGNSGYDLVVPSSQFLARQIKAGVFQKLDKSKLSNIKNLDVEMLKALQVNDPGNAYAMPYLWGTTGLGYNKEKLAAALGKDQAIDSWNLFFDPKMSSKLKACGISALDAAGEVLSAALFYKGLDPNSSNPKDYEGPALETMMAVRPNIRYFNSSQYITDLANGDLCLALGWSGDASIAASRAAEAKKPFEISYIIPKEGAGLWFDMMAIPADAKHPNNALLFMNYIMEPKVIAGISNFVTYANPNTASIPFLDKAVVDNPNIYPPASVKARLYSYKLLSPDVERIRTRVWTKIKTGT